MRTIFNIFWTLMFVVIMLYLFVQLPTILLLRVNDCLVRCLAIFQYFDLSSLGFRDTIFDVKWKRRKIKLMA